MVGAVPELEEDPNATQTPTAAAAAAPPIKAAVPMVADSGSSPSNFGLFEIDDLSVVRVSEGTLLF